MKNILKLKRNEEMNVVETGNERADTDTAAEKEDAAENEMAEAKAEEEAEAVLITSEAEMNDVEIAISSKPLSIGAWYVTFMCMSVPILGWIYLFIIAFTEKDPGRRQFARAWLLYRLTILIACILLITVAVHMLIPYVDQLLNYMETL